MSVNKNTNKKTKIKRMLSIVLMLCMIITLMPIMTVPAYAENYGRCGKKLIWTLDDDGTLTISGTGEMNIEDYADSSWSANKKKVKKIIINHGVTSICDYAFLAITEDYRYKSNLKEVYIPDSVTRIGKNAFEGCKNLEIINASWKNISEIGEQAFIYCEKLNLNIEFSNYLKKIGNNAFEDCKSLNSVKFTDNKVSLGSSVFKNCRNLTSVVLSNYNEEITIGMFENCSSLSVMNVPKNLKKISENAFKGCSNLPGETIQQLVNTAEELGEYAFKACQKLTNITIPSTVKSIGTWLFSGCHNLVAAEIKPSNLKAIPDSLFEDCRKLAKIIIPSNINEIGMGAFYNCDELNTVLIPENVSMIGANAFNYCHNLKGVYFKGIAPQLGSDEKLHANTIFPDTVTLYYIEGKKDWPAFSNTGVILYKGYKTALWKGNPIKITNVAITGVKEPVVGEHPSYEYELSTTPANSAVKKMDFGINGLIWYKYDGYLKEMKPTDTFEKDGIYQVYIGVTPANGLYYFDNENNQATNYYYGTVTLNEKKPPFKPAVANREEKWLSVRNQYNVRGPLTFTDSQSYDIPEGKIGTYVVYFDVSSAVSGGVPQYKFSKASGPDWLIVRENGVVTGKRPNTGREATTATIMVTDSNNQSKTIKINVGKVNEPIEVSSISVYVTEPKVGENPAKPSASNSNYVINEYHWIEIVDGKEGDELTSGTFKVGKTYRLKLVVVPNNNNPVVGYKFKEDATAKINGQMAEIEWQGVGHIWCHRDFEISGPLTFEDSEDYDIPAGSTNSIYYIADNPFKVVGGIKPYTFKVEPAIEGMEVSKDGKAFMYLRPSTAQKATTATIKVTDAVGASQSIEINVGEVTLGSYKLTFLRGISGGLGTEYSWENLSGTVTLPKECGYTPANPETEFVYWTSDHYNKIKVTEIDMYTDREVYAFFDFKKYDLTVVGGTANGNVNARYMKGENYINLKANIPEGKTFKNWTDDGGGIFEDANSAETYYTMPGNASTITANFESIRSELTVINGKGSGNHPVGEAISIEANPASDGQCFKEWTGEGIKFADGSKATDPIARIIMPNKAITVKATYEEKVKYTVAINGGGTGISGAGKYEVGALVFVEPGTKEGYTFKNWTSPDITISDPNAETVYFSMPDNDVTLTANWILSKQNVTVKESYAAITGSGEYAVGDMVIIDAGTREGYTFSGWTSEDVKISEAYTATTVFLMPEKEVVVIANWTANSGGGTTPTPGPGTGGGGGGTTPTPTPVTTPVVKTTVDKDENVIADVTVPEDTVIEKVEIPAELGEASGTVFAEIKYEDGTTKKTMAVYEDCKVSVKLEGNAIVKVLKDVTDFATIPSFVDISKHWAKQYIEDTAKLGLFNGKSATNFGTDDNMTREQMWMVLSRLQGEGQATMEDAKNWAMANGVSDGTNPKGNVTREQLVTLLWRASGEPKSNYTLSAFGDNSKVSDWAKDAFAWAVEIGLVNGTTADTLSPQNTATRGQLAAIFARLIY